MLATETSSKWPQQFMNKELFHSHSVPKMEIGRLIWMTVCLLDIGQTFGLTINCDNSGLTSIPDDIDPSVSYLDCKYNEISTITRSDFNDKYPELEIVILNWNKITSVEYGCFKGTVLKRIFLFNNQLTIFPDFYEVKDTLAVVSAARNRITKISNNEINYLTKLATLYLDNNPLVQLPELAYLCPSLDLLYLIDIELECCQSTVWMKRIPDTLYVCMNEQPCSTPLKWNQTNWNDLTEDMLLQQPCEMPSLDWTPSGCHSETTTAITTLTTQPPIVTTDETTMTTQPPIVTTDETTLTTQPSIVTTDETTLTTQPPIVTTDETTMTTQPPIVTTDETTLTTQTPIVTTDETTLTTKPPIVTTGEPKLTNASASDSWKTSPVSSESQEYLNLTTPAALGMTISPSTELPPSFTPLLPSLPMATIREYTTPDNSGTTDSSTSTVPHQRGSNIIPRKRPPLPPVVNDTREKIVMVDSKHITSHVVIGSSFVIAILSVLLLVVLSDIPRILQHIYYLNVPYGRIFGVDQSRKQRKKVMRTKV